jgi:hypothetical protein
MVESKTDALGIIAAEFPAGVRPILTVTSRIVTKDCAVDLSARGTAPKESRAELEHFLSHQAAADRRHRESNSKRNHEGLEDGC